MKNRSSARENTDSLTGLSASQHATVIFVTHVPFWRAGTGAQQRMLSLYRYFEHRNEHVVIFYLPELTAEDRSLIDQLGLRVRGIRKGKSREALWSRLGDRLQSFLNRSRESESVEAGVTAAGTSQTRPLVPDDFCWPGAREQFREFVDAIRPQLIVVEYISLACYAGFLTPEQRARCPIVLDAHDVMFQRCERFRAEGKQNWLEISREQEAQLLGGFDAILAIQEDEAETFRRLAPQVEIIVAGHCPVLPAQNTLQPSTASGPVQVGFLGSDNQPNLLAARWLVEQIWPRVLANCDVKPKLLLAGGFIRALPELVEIHSTIELMPQLKDLSPFYSRVQVVVNPVKLGTGLKIKSVEALSWGKPLVTTSHSAMGLPDSLRNLIDIEDDAERFARAIAELINDEQHRHQVTRSVWQLAQREFQPNRVYRDLSTWMENLS